jgi:hypothetical protein
MPFINEYWPFIAAGVICYLGAKFLYHSAVSWNPNPGAVQSYETADKGTRILIQIWLQIHYVCDICCISLENLSVSHFNAMNIKIK